MDTLSKRQLQILLYLRENTEPVSSEYLSKTMGISSKTIRKDISEILRVLSNHGATIISKTGIGFMLSITDQIEFDKFLSAFDENEHKVTDALPMTFQRAHYIIRKMLTANGYVKINDIADELFTSRTTTTSDMRYVKDILNEYDITIQQRPNHGLLLVGKEHNIRLCMVDEYNHYKNNDLFVNEEEYASFFNVDETTYEQIENFIFQAQIRFSTIDISYQNIQKIVWMIILSSRRSNYDLKASYTDDDMYSFQVRNTYHIAKSILHNCEPLLNATFHKEDIVLLTIYLISYRNFVSIKDVANRKRYYTYYDFCENLMDYLCEINEFKELYRDNQLHMNLALHFMSMRPRLDYKVKIDYIPRTLVKQKSPTAMELAVQSAQYLEQNLHLHMNEDEICYLALVFFPVFGRFNTGNNKRRLIIVSSISKTVGATMAERFERNFGHYIETIEIKELYELRKMNLESYDLIFTDLSEGSIKFTQVPIIHINTFFSEEDKKDIRNILTLGNTNFSKMKNYFLEDLFFTNVNVKTKEEVFQFLYEQVHKKFKFSKEFYDDLVARDDLSSIEIGNNVAMMKTKQSYCETSFISVMILDKPIIWKYESVQILVLWHRGIHDQTITEIFESGYMGNVLKSIFSISEKIVNLLQKPDFETMLSMIKDRVESTKFLDALEEIEKKSI